MRRFGTLNDATSVCRALERVFRPWGVAEVSFYDDFASRSLIFVATTDDGVPVEVRQDRAIPWVDSPHHIAQTVARRVLAAVVDVMNPWEYLVRVQDNGVPPL